MYNIILSELKRLVFSSIHLMKNEHTLTTKKAFEMALLANDCTPPPLHEKSCMNP